MRKIMAMLLMLGILLTNVSFAVAETEEVSLEENAALLTTLVEEDSEDLLPEATVSVEEVIVESVKGITSEPTSAPTEEPNVAPTEEPTVAPTEEPTVAPTEEPTVAPTEEPTVAPTEEPTPEPNPFIINGADILVAGKKVTLTAKYNDAVAKSKDITWKSSNKSVATVSSAGIVTAKKVKKLSEVTITATYKKGNKESVDFTITVIPAVSKVTVVSDTGLSIIDLNSDEPTLQLTAKCLPADAKQAVTWKSSNAKIATVNADGLVTGKKNGKVTITATATDGSKKSVNFSVNVVRAVQNIEISGPESVVSKKSITLKAVVTPSSATNKKIVWTTSNKKVATVSSSGVVKAASVKQLQYVTIKATSAENKDIFAEQVIAVRPLANSVTINSVNGKKVLGSLGDTLQLMAVCMPQDASQSVKWTTSNEKIATVDENGVVTAKGKGTVSITATSQDGSKKKASFSVKVVGGVEKINISGPSQVVAGKSVSLTATITPADAMNKGVVWSCSDTSVAQIDENGVVTTTSDIVWEKEVTFTATSVENPKIYATHRLTIHEFFAVDKTNVVFSSASASAQNITVKYKGQDSVYWQCTNTGVVKPEWSGNWKNNTTTLILKPQGPGMATVTLTNDSNDTQLIISVSVNDTDIAKKVYYLGNKVFDLYDTNEYILSFTLMDKAETTYLTPAATVDVRIVNDNGVTVYSKVHDITANDYRTWTVSGRQIRKASIYISPEEIASGDTKNGKVYFSVHRSGYFNFNESVLATNDLPKYDPTRGYKVKYADFEEMSDGRFALTYGLYDEKSATYASLASSVDVEIVNDDGITVYRETHNITVSDYKMWSTYNGRITKAVIYISPDDIYKTDVRYGNVYFTVYGGDGFKLPEEQVRTYDLPQYDPSVECTLEVPAVPRNISDYTYSGKIDSSLKVTNIEYKFTATNHNEYVKLTLYFSGNKLYDRKGNGYSQSGKIGYKLYDCYGNVVESGTCYTPNICVGNTFSKVETYVYDLKPGSYILEILDTQ